MSRPTPAPSGPSAERRSPRTERPARGPSAELIMDGVVASYIHAISERHTPAPAAGRHTLPAGGEQLG